MSHRHTHQPDPTGNRLAGDLPWLIAALLGLLAPWLLGGRAPQAHAFLGGLAWAVVIAGLIAVLLRHREWAPMADYYSRRGSDASPPLRLFAHGLLRTLPFWMFAAFLAIAAFNPAYRPDGDRLVQVDYIDWLPLVIDPERSRPGIFFLSGLTAAFAILVNPALHIRRRLARTLLASLLLNAVILAWVGIVFRFAGNGQILGIFPAPANYFFATFYYKNHWAAYALLHCGIAAGLFFRDLPRWAEKPRQTGSSGLAIVAIICLGLTLPVADSRSGVLLFALFVAGFLAILFFRLHSRRGRLFVGLSMLISTATFASLTAADLREAWKRTEKQIEQAESPFFIDNIRLRYGPETCLAMLRDRPFLGWGYLSFEPLFPVYAPDYFRKPDSDRLRANMEFAHNDLLQHLAEFGVIGSSLLLLGFLSLPYPNPNLNPNPNPNPNPGGAVRRLRLRLGLGLGLRLGINYYSGLVLLLLYSLFEFPFSNPAVLSSAVVIFLLGRRAERRPDLR